MKKIVTAAFLLMFILSTFIPVQMSTTQFPASANQGLVFSLAENVEATPGQQRVRVDITASGTNPGFAAVVFEVGFNTSHIQLVEVDAPNVGLPVNGFTDINFEPRPNVRWIMLYDFANAYPDWTGTGTVVSLFFNVLPGAPAPTSTIPITLGFTSTPDPIGRPASYETEDFVAAATRNGSILIVPADTPPPPLPGQVTLTIVGGGTGATVSSNRFPGDAVTVNAGTQEGYTFSGWTAAPSTFNIPTPSSPVVSFFMPDNNLILTANWTQDATQTPTPTPTPPPPPDGQYQLRVVGAGAGGTQTGNHLPGATVTLNAGTPPAGQTFVNWTVSPTTASLTNPTSPTAAQVTMPSTAPTTANNIITVTAIWTHDATPPPTQTPTPSPTPTPTPTPTPPGGGAGGGNGGYDGGGFGEVPKTGIPSITGTVITMWMSIIMTVVLGVCLFTYMKSKQKNRKYGSDHEDYK